VLSRRTIQLATLGFLFIGFLFTTTSAFAYWQEVTVTRDVEIVRIGEPVQILVTDINENLDGVNLVPEGYMIAVGDVEQVQFQYEVGVSRELLTTVLLHVSTVDVLINNDDTYSHLVDIDIMGFGNSATLDLYNETITITITVRLIEPIDAAEAIERGLDASLVNVEDSVLAYETIRGQTITFALEFLLEATQELDN
jgi:hypothetical protein